MQHSTTFTQEKTTACPAPTHGQGGEASEHKASQGMPGQDGGGGKGGPVQPGTMGALTQPNQE